MLPVASIAGAQTRSTSPATPANAKGAATSGPILVLGDSLSAEYGLQRGSGWVDLLVKRLAGRRPPGPSVVNASISGDTTAGGRNRLPTLLQRHQPSIVIIELGGNDALRGLDLKMTEANLRAMLSDAKKAGAVTLLLGMMLPPNYGKAYGDRFSAVFKSAAQAEQSPLVPFFLQGVAEHNELFQADRIHPTEQAQPRMLDNVWLALEPLLKAVHGD